MGRYTPPLRDPKDLERFGPRLEIEVRPPVVPSLKGLAVSSGKVSRMPALIDTGASRTVLTPEAIQKLELPLIQYAKLSRAGGMDDKVAVHVASIQFTSRKLAPIDVLEVFCCELPTQPVQCLIGRDILSQWLFVYNGKTGDWWIEEEGAAMVIEPPDDIFG